MYSLYFIFVSIPVKFHLSLPETGASLGKAVLEQFYATDILKNGFIHEANLITVGVETVFRV